MGACYRFPMDFLCSSNVWFHFVSHQKVVMNLHPEVLPSAMAEGLIELEVIGMSGECMLTLNVAHSMLGRELWRIILDKVPSKLGLQLVVSHTSRLVLHESLQQQGLVGQQAQVWATYMPVNLHAAWRFAQGYSVEDAEFSLTGITEVTGVDDENTCLAAQFAPEPSHLNICGWVQPEPGQRDMASGPSMLDFR